MVRIWLRAVEIWVVFQVNAVTLEQFSASFFGCALLVIVIQLPHTHLSPPIALTWQHVVVSSVLI